MSGFFNTNGPSDFVYHDGHLTIFQGPQPPQGIPDTAFDLASVYGPYIGPGFIYSPYMALSSSAVLNAEQAYTFQFPPLPFCCVSAKFAGSNDIGQTVGAGTYGSFIYMDGMFSALPGVGEPLGINDHSQIVGSYFTNQGHMSGFIDTDGSVTLLDFPGAFGTEAFAINDHGLVVGDYYRSAQGAALPFIYDNGQYIGIPGAGFGSIVGVNDNGDAMGWGGAPVPEPGTWALMLIGFTLAFGFSRLYTGRVGN